MTEWFGREMGDWFVVQNEQEKGPFSWDQLKLMALIGDLDFIDGVRQDGKKQIRAAGSVRPISTYHGSKVVGDWLIPRWYVLKLGRQRGPYPPEYLLQPVSFTNEFHCDLVRRYDKTEWQSAVRVRAPYNAFGKPISPEAEWDETHQLAPRLPWYILKLQDRTGPYTTDEMIELSSTGYLLPDDLVAAPPNNLVWAPARSFPFHDKSRLLETFDQSKSTPHQDPVVNQSTVSSCHDLSKALSCVAFSNDGRWQLEADLSQRIHVHDRDNPMHINSLHGEKVIKYSDGTREPPFSHADTITSLTFAPDNRTAASCSRDGAVRIWDVSSCRPCARLRHRSATSVAFLHGGKVLASCGDGGVRLWDVASGQLKTRLRARNRVLDLCVVNDTHLLTVGHGNIGVWNTDSPELLQEIYTPWLYCISASSSPYCFAAAGLNRLFFWRLNADLTLADLWWLPCPDRIHCLHFSPNGKYLVTAGASPVLRIWDVDKKVSLDWRHEILKGAVHDMAFQCASNQTVLITAGDDGLLRWNFSEGEDT